MIEEDGGATTPDMDKLIKTIRDGGDSIFIEGKDDPTHERVCRDPGLLKPAFTAEGFRIKRHIDLSTEDRAHLLRMRMLVVGQGLRIPIEDAETDAEGNVIFKALGYRIERDPVPVNGLS